MNIKKICKRIVIKIRNTGDDEVCIKSLSSIILAVHSMEGKFVHILLRKTIV